MSEPPTQLDYASPHSAPRKGIPKSHSLGFAAIVVGSLAFMMPPISGSGIVGPNVFYTPTWCLAFVLLDLSIWWHLAESKPTRFTGSLIVGVGVTGMLASLAGALLLWKPDWPLLAGVCFLSVLVTTIGCWMSTRRSVPASPV